MSRGFSFPNDVLRLLLDEWVSGDHADMCALAEVSVQTNQQLKIVSRVYANYVLPSLRISKHALLRNTQGITFLNYDTEGVTFSDYLGTHLFIPDTFLPAHVVVNILRDEEHSDNEEHKDDDTCREQLTSFFEKRQTTIKKLELDDTTFMCQVSPSVTSFIWYADSNTWQNDELSKWFKNPVGLRELELVQTDRWLHRPDQRLIWDFTPFTNLNTLGLTIGLSIGQTKISLPDTLHTFEGTPGALECFAKPFPKLTRLKLNGCLDKEDIDNILVFKSSLTHLGLCGLVSDFAPLQKLEQLTSLALHNCAPDKAKDKNATLSFPNLQKLHMDSGTYILAHAPLLRSLSLKNAKVFVTSKIELAKLLCKGKSRVSSGDNIAGNRLHFTIDDYHNFRDDPVAVHHDMYNAVETLVMSRECLHALMQNKMLTKSGVFPRLKHLKVTRFTKKTRSILKNFFITRCENTLQTITVQADAHSEHKFSTSTQFSILNMCRQNLPNIVAIKIRPALRAHKSANHRSAIDHRFYNNTKTSHFIIKKTVAN